MAITITPEALAKSAVKYRKELLMMVAIGLQNSLQHMTLRTGVQYKEMVGELSGNSEFAPYDPTRKNTSSQIKGRELEVFLGSVIKEFDPNAVLQSIYGSLVLSGKEITDVDIVKAVLAAEMKSLSKKLNGALFGAVRNAEGTTSKDLFNGFDTIAAAEITAGNLTVENKNLFEFSEAITAANAVDQLKALYRACSDELQEGEKVKMFLPKTIKNFYDDDYQATVGPIVYNKEFNKSFLEGSGGMCELVPLASKSGSGFIQITTKDNMIVGTGSGNDLEKLSVDRFSAFMVTLSSAILFGCQYDTISPEKLMVGKLFVAP